MASNAIRIIGLLAEESAAIKGVIEMLHDGTLTPDQIRDHALATDDAAVKSGNDWLTAHGFTPE